MQKTRTRKLPKDPKALTVVKLQFEIQSQLKNSIEYIDDFVSK